MHGTVSISRNPWVVLARLVVIATWLPVAAALAVPMHNDSNGFEGIPWGAAFSESDTFMKVEDGGRVQTYEIKGMSPTLGPTSVDSMRFSTIDGGFARVTVRYSGKEAHDRILDFLQQRFGPLDRTPGQVAGGVVKVFDWQGADSEIILRYDVRTSQGIIFFESQVFRGRFNESSSPSAF
ncbi:MAG: hypothetical protein HY348_03325 [Nitrospira defluvii]|nr:hypothetical protein [Nitrospira defluvii]